MLILSVITSYSIHYTKLYEVYKDVSSLVNLYTTQNTVLGLINHPKPFALTNNFEIIETELLSSNDAEIKIDSGTLNIGLIRIRNNFV